MQTFVTSFILKTSVFPISKNNSNFHVYARAAKHIHPCRGPVETTKRCLVFFFFFKLHSIALIINIVMVFAIYLVV